MVVSKIDALKIVDEDILRAVQRIERNTLNPNKNDIFYLMERYNECNTSGYTKREVTVCADCRRYLFKFWQNVIIEWKKTKPCK